MKRLLLFGFLLIPVFGKAQVVDTVAVRVEVDSLVQLNRKLVGQSKFVEALQVIEKGDSVALAAFGKNSALNAKCLFNHGRTYHIMSEYDKAESLYLEAKAIREKVLENEHPDYIGSLNNLAVLYKDRGEYEKAEPLYLEVKAIREKTLGKEHPDYASSLHNLANFYSKQEDYVNAIPLYLESKNIREKVFGKKHPDYIWSIYNLANSYLHNHDYETAEPMYLEAKDIMAKVLGKDHLDYAWCLNNLGILYERKGEYDKAESLHLEVKTIREKVLGKDHPDYSSCLNNLSNVYVDKGEYSKAEMIILEAKGITEKNLGKAPSGYAMLLYNLASLYHEKGEFDKAESLYLEAKVIREKTLGKEHPDNANILDGLAILYREKGEFNKAEPLYLEAKTLREKAFGKEHPYYAASLNNLAILYMEEDEFGKAEQMCLESKMILEKVLGTEHPNCLASIESLANLYTYKGEYDKAEPLYLYTKAIRAKILEKEHPDYATTLINLAAFYWKKGLYHESEPLFLEAKAIQEKIFTKEHPNYITTIQSIAFLYRDLGQPKISEQYFTEASSITKHILQKSTTYLPNQELEKHIALYQDENNAFYAFNHLTTSDSFRIQSYNNALFYKGFALETASHLEQAMQAAPDSIRDIHSRWKGYNRLLATELAKPIAERKHVSRLDSMSIVLEKILLRAVPTFAEVQRQVEWQEVRDALQPGESAIEFIHYRYSDKKVTDSTMYSALLTLPGDHAPHFIPLCEARQLDTLISKRGGSRANYLQNLYASPRTDGLPSLKQLLWSPIEKFLQEKGIKTVYYSPTGLLHRINLSAISDDKSGIPLADRYHLVPMGSTRQLATERRKEEHLQLSDALIYGGIRYEMDSSAITTANAKLNASAQDTTGGLFGFARLTEGSRGENWDYLPGTEKEARYLDSLLRHRGVSTTLRLDYQATEESLKQIGQNAPSPSLLHIGTHGFFFPDPKARVNVNGEEPVFKISEYSMIRSGLKMAGSRYAWENGHPLPGGHEDGILTAYEVSQMNLSNTQLVVLSACETGLGDIRGNEGVYGLQRAFRIAGAKNVLMSLWKVPDDATEKLMTQFYHHWLVEKKPLRESFEAAQQWLRGQKGFDNPYYWAGFVLVGEL